MLLKVSREEDQIIIQRQRALLQKGFPMGKLRYKEREGYTVAENKLLDRMFWCTRTTFLRRGGGRSLEQAKMDRQVFHRQGRK